MQILPSGLLVPGGAILAPGCKSPPFGGLLGGRVQAAPSPLLTGLGAYYAMETLGLDSTGNGNTLTNNGGVTQVAGVIDLGADCATNQSLSRTIAALDSAATVSIAGWMKRAAGTDEANLLAGEVGAAYRTGIVVFTDGNVYAVISNGASEAASCASVVANGAWGHYALVFDGNQTGDANRLKLYINGALQTLSFSGSVPATTAPNADQGPFKISSEVRPAAAAQFDETGIWSRALTADEVASLYNAGTGRTYPFLGG